MAIAEPVAAAPAAPEHNEALALADGVELIGEYQGSGFKEPPLLARRSDGQVIQLTRLGYLIARAADGRSDADAVAAVASEDYGRNVSGRSVNFLVERTLRPLGVLAQADGSTPELEKREPVMALRHRRALLSERGVNAIARGFVWLHRPPVLALVVLTLAAFDVWLFGIHGIAGGLRSALYQPVLLLGVIASVVVATAFHEIGHASACRYGGARPGVMGVGVYLVWPAFYCDVTDAYRLDRPGRLRTDLGGVYFNGIFALLAGAGYFATGEEAFLLVAFVQHTIALQQLLPLLRFDGYYVLSDLTGVPDILTRVKPIFRSLIPRRQSEPRVEELKPWVRLVVTAYLLVLIPLLAFLLISTVLSAPRMMATAYDSLGMQIDRLRSGAGATDIVLGAVQSAALVLPLAAIAVSLTRTGRMAIRGLASWSAGSALRRLVAVAGTAAVVAGAAYTWWPNGDYEPIRPGERGTVGEALTSVRDAPGGRPSWTEAREQRFGRVPTVREHGAAERRADRRTRRSEPVRPAGSPDAIRTPATGARDREPDGGEDDPGTSPQDGVDSPTATPGTSPSATATPSGGSTPSTPSATPTPTPTASPAGPSPTPTPTADSPTLSATVPPTPDAVPTATPSVPSPIQDATATP